MQGLVLSTWRYRYFIVSSIKVEFRGRFIRSRLGGLWMIIHPLVQAAIFALILGQLLSGRLPDMADNRLAYPIYLLAGTLAWNLFSEVISRCLTVFIDNANLLKKLVFPRACLPLIVAGSALFNNMLLFAAIVLIFLLLGFVPGVHLVWIPVLTLINLGLSLGLGLILGTLNVFMRDIGQIVPIVLQLGFWFTPIVYTPNILPERIARLLQLNPMYWVIQGYQNAILYDAPPSWTALGVISAIAVLLLGLSFVIFRRANSEIVDVL
jgi:lipopolysaccharide transport system permease protein